MSSFGCIRAVAAGHESRAEARVTDELGAVAKGNLLKFERSSEATDLASIRRIGQLIGRIEHLKQERQG